MNEITQNIQNTPGLDMVPAVLAIAIGLVLWAAGRRVLRPALALTAGVMGVGLGWILAGWLLTSFPDYAPPVWATAATVGVFLALLGALVYRLAVAGALAVVGAVVVPSVVLVIAEWSAPAPPSADASPMGPAAIDQSETYPPGTGPLHDLIDEANDWLFEDDAPAPLREPSDNDLPDEHASADDARADAPPGAAQEPRDSGSMFPTVEDAVLGEENAERLAVARGHAERAVGAAQDWWDRVPSSTHPTLVGAVIAGILAGLLLGTLAPVTSAMIVTAAMGAGFTLSGFTMLLSGIGAIEEPATGQSAPWLMLVWLIVSIIGLAIQWMFRPKPADTPA